MGTQEKIPDDKAFDIITKHVKKHPVIDVDELIRELAPLQDSAKEQPQEAQESWIRQVTKRGKDYLPELHVNLSEALPTGLQKLDDILEGGLRKSEMGLLVGMPESGKTRTLCNFAATLLGKKRIAFVCLEQPWFMMRKFLIMARLDLYEEEVSWPLIRRIKEYEDADMVIPIDMSNKGYRVSDLDKLLANLEVTPDILFVDYLDLLDPAYYKSQLRWQYDETSKALARLAKQYKLALWTATQADISAIYKVIGYQTIAESKIGKTAHISAGVGLKRIQDDPTRTIMNVFKKRRKDKNLPTFQVSVCKYRMVDNVTY